jgi:iron only hydrogenase large subunit-like protein
LVKAQKSPCILTIDLEENNVKRLHSVSLNRDLCVGCTNCIKGCPTEAIRVRDGKAVIDENRCIDCAECIRICPHHAKKAVTDPIPSFSGEKGEEPHVALIPPSLYSQFASPATRADVLHAVYEMGFDYVYEVALGAAASSERTSEIIREIREKHAQTTVSEDSTRADSPEFPLISSACPVVVRLIQMKYKSLIPHLVPLDAPMEITARFARSDVSSRMHIDPMHVRIHFFSPCPSKRSATLNPLGQKKSDVDYVIAIHEAYPILLSIIEKNVMKQPKNKNRADTHLLAHPNGVQWATSGGEASTLHTEKYMAVDGIRNVISILNEIENENVKDIEFIEPSCCFGGCIGGPLSATNSFSAKARMRSIIRDANNNYTQHPDKYIRPDTLDPHVWDVPLSDNNAMRLDADIEKALGKYDQMEKLLATLPGLDCGACGAPSCAALAEDIVQGNALETDCIIKLKEQIRKVAKDIHILSL